MLSRIALISFHVIAFFFVVIVVGGAIILQRHIATYGDFDAALTLPLQIYALAACAVTAILVLMLTPRTWQNAVVATLSSATLVAFYVTIFAPGGTRQFNGDVTDTLKAAVTNPRNLIALVAVIGIAIVGYRYRRIIRHIHTVVCLTALALVGYVYATHIERAVAGESAAGTSLDKLYEFGQKGNVVVVLMDMLQGYFLEHAHRTDAGIRTTLADFTIFPRTTATFPFTNYSLPSLLHGAPYASEHKEFSSNLDAAIRDSFLTDARKHGYSTTSVQSEWTLATDTQDSIFAFFVPDRDDEPVVTREQYFRSTHPIALIAASVARVTKINLLPSDMAVHELIQAKRSGRNLLARWAKHARVGDHERRMMFVHNFLTHAPVVYDRDGRILPIPISKRTHRGHVVDEIGYAFDLLGSLFAQMKRLGIYDDALIIIVGDHGHFAGFNPDAFIGPVEGFDGTNRGGNFLPATMYNAALLVKPPRASSGAILQDPAGLVDVRPLIREYLQNGSLDPGASMKRIRAASGGVPVMTCGDPDLVSYTRPICHEIRTSNGDAYSLPSLFGEVGPRENTPR